ncbi:MAG: hypothetical protein HC890_13715 [Chloroflexaceae bacterium]|nr:hypothetical protein [Chloroflexaceae bacterium]
MPAQEKLTGLELVDCAKANAKLGLTTATENCGYGQNSEEFFAGLQAACQHMGIDINELGDLVTPQQRLKEGNGIEIAPDTPSEL